MIDGLLFFLFGVGIGITFWEWVGQEWNRQELKECKQKLKRYED